MAQLYTRRIRGNNKIPVPPEVRALLIRDPENQSVCWNYHTEQRIAVLSDIGLGLGFDDYAYVDTTKIMDDNRYIRAPKGLPEEIQNGFQQEKRKATDIAIESLGTSRKRFHEQMAETYRNHPEVTVEDLEEALEEDVSNQAGFVVIDELVSDDDSHPNIVYLLSEKQLWDRLGSRVGDTLPDTANAVWTSVSKPQHWMMDKASSLADELQP